MVLSRRADPAGPARPADPPGPVAVPVGGRPVAWTPVRALGVRIDRLDTATALRRALELLRAPGSATIAFVNAHSLNLADRDHRYRCALQRSDLVLNDGVGVALLGRVVGAPFVANLNGTDFVPLLLDHVPPGCRVFLYGGRPGVAERAAQRLAARHRDACFVGCLDGYTVEGAQAADVVRRRGADLVLVAMGNPRQELWADRYAGRSGASLVVSVGAFLDFAAGEVSRAPVAVRRARLEWFYRLGLEPRRLAGRYLVGIPAFLARVAATWCEQSVDEGLRRVRDEDYPGHHVAPA